jgi:choline-sulfatase
VRTRDWKYVYNGFDFDELYDLREDPDCMRNVASEPSHSGVVRDMCRRMWIRAYELNDSCADFYPPVSLAPWGPAVAFSKDRGAGKTGEM